MRLLGYMGGLAALVALLAGCQTMGKEPENTPPSLERTHARLMDESKKLQDHQSELRRDLEQLESSPKRTNPHELLTKGSQDAANRLQTITRDMQVQGDQPPTPDPVEPEYDPLDDILVSLEMDKADVRHLLQALAKQTNMNLLLHPQVVSNPPILSVSFSEVPASTVFREILQTADLYGRVEDNVLRVELFQESVFDLDFMETNMTTNFSVGGDVLGAATSSNNVIGGMTGSFNVSGQGPAVSNPYQKITEIIQPLVTAGGGSYHLNSMTGTLYVKAKPSALKTVSGLINRYKEILGRQILIEARIMEIRLTDQFRAGVDWALLRNSVSASSGLAQSITTNSGQYPFKGSGDQGVKNPAFGLGNFASATTSDLSTGSIASLAGFGLAMAGRSGLVALDMLKQFGEVQVLSNPSIRAKHGQPAMISVGRSSAYIRQTEVTVADTATTTGVDVQTETVFDGLILGVIPFISNEGRVSLVVHPIQSDVQASTLTPTQVGTSTTAVSLPQVDLKEISTVLDLNNNDTVFIGGLIDKNRTEVRTGVPVLSEIPLLGRLFTKDQNSEIVSELVIMLRVQIL
ncbi:MAG: pilus (MSHA type) biogenesis protein MshL [Magnetococcales bacterium]|nr:pilus (MSHA type) biogenesis protein MshL [Magnetococcales bacterium]